MINIGQIIAPKIIFTDRENYNYLIIGIYRPHDIAIDVFITELNKYLENVIAINLNRYSYSYNILEITIVMSI